MILGPVMRSPKVGLQFHKLNPTFFQISDFHLCVLAATLRDMQG